MTPEDGELKRDSSGQLWQYDAETEHWIPVKG